MSDAILVKDDGPIRTVRMNRAEKKNALTADMYAAMANAIEGAEQNPEIRCVLIGGAPSVFCAGNDIGDFLKASASGGLAPEVLHFLHALARCAKPLVAAVQGNAIGVGTTMLLHCDHVVASEDARFATPFVGLGLVPEAASSLIAPRLMGHARAFSLLVMGQPLSADAAKTAGLINTIAPADQIEGEAMKAARHIAALPPQAMLAARHLMRGTRDEIAARIDEEADAFKIRLQSPEAQAAFQTFMTRKR
ncbi:MAG: crotonase/enoyl-CoA hydratase family protein [Pseudolabrys sp.]